MKEFIILDKDKKSRIIEEIENLLKKEDVIANENIAYQSLKELAPE